MKSLELIFTRPNSNVGFFEANTSIISYIKDNYILPKKITLSITNKDNKSTHFINYLSNNAYEELNSDTTFQKLWADRESYNLSNGITEEKKFIE